MRQMLRPGFPERQFSISRFSMPDTQLIFLNSLNPLSLSFLLSVIQEFFTKLVVLPFILLPCWAIQAQTEDNTLMPVAGSPWSLEQCISYGISHNIQVKQVEINVNIAKNNLTGSKANLLPSVNGGADHIYNFGRTIDLYTNTFANSEVLSEDFFVSASFTLYGGLQNKNTLRQYEKNVEASNYDLTSNKNTLSLNIASAYLQVLLNKELLEEVTKQQSLSEAQVKRTKLLVDAGNLARSNLFDIEAQEANDEVNTVNAQNQVDISLLALTQLLNLDSAKMLSIIPPLIEVSASPALPDNPDEVYDKALTIQPDVKSAQLKWLSAQKATAVSKGALMPKLLLAASAGTGYSGSDEEIINSIPQGLEPVGITSGGETVYVPNVVYQYGLIPYSNQLNENFNKSFGLRLNIPIFNGLQSNIAYRNAKLNELNSYYTFLNSRITLHKNVESAFTDALGALKKYIAEEKSVASFTEAFNYTQSKFDEGVATALDYNVSKTNLEKAKSDQLQAKYTYIFKLKVLDYYEGKPLKL